MNGRGIPSTAYSQQWHERLAVSSARSANLIVPIVLEAAAVTSVLDVGCGTGAWLKAFRDCGVEDVVGLDGDYVSRRDLHIPPDRFRAHDLAHPFSLGRRFDLAASVEVAEHLPQSCGRQFVRCLAEHADVILFSAAIPKQGGTGHINEQWQSYWAAIFADHGYRAIDVVRPRIWNVREVERYYRQNILIYANGAGLMRNPKLLPTATPLDVVHPEQYAAATPEPYFSGAVKSLPGLLVKAVRNRF
jgi:SAM-dependent methyltransferase